MRLLRRLLLWGTRAGGGGVTYDYYINFVSGDDLDDGSEASPWASVTKGQTVLANNVSYALARGSNFELQGFSSVSIDGVTVAGVGSGALPIIDGSAVVTGWTEHATQANVWEKSVDHDGTSNSRLMVFEDGVLMTRQTSDALTNSNAGSFRDRKASDADPWTVLIHPTGSGDPNSNGKVYRVSSKSALIELDDNCIIQDVHLRRSISSTGPLALNRNCTVARVVSEYGTKHNIRFGSGSLTDVICVGSDVVTSYEPSQTYLVAYDDVPNGLEVTMTRVGAFADLAGTRRGNAFIQHAAGAGDIYGTTTMRQCWGVDLGQGYEPSSEILRIEGQYIKNGNQAFGCYSDDAIIDYLLVNNGALTGRITPRTITVGGPAVIKFRNCVFYDTGAVNSVFALTSSLQGCSLEFENCILYHSAFTTTFAATSTWSSGTLKMNNCITVYSNNNSAPILVPASITYEGNNNVWLCNTNGGTNLNMSYQGVVYDTMATWRAATGQDANSLAYGPSDLAGMFAGTVANGDFRLAGSGSGAAAAAIGAGVVSRWNWNTRAAESGAPTAWPAVPDTLAEALTYANDPDGWTF